MKDEYLTIDEIVELSDDGWYSISLEREDVDSEWERVTDFHYKKRLCGRAEK